MAEETYGSAGQSGVFLEPKRIVGNFALARGDYAADFGAGHGYFTIPMAKAVGGDGKVFAVDIQKSTLDIIRARAALENILNIELVWADLDAEKGSGLKDGFIDFVLCANVLFQSEKKKAVLTEAFRVLRQGGRLAVIEWDEGVTPLGPPAQMRLKKEEVKNLAAESGFDFDREVEAGSRHYGLLFAKK